MNINIVDILNTGVTGFAFIMLLLGYRLTSEVQSKIFEQKIGDFPNIDMYREWQHVASSQLKNTRYFLLFSFVFFACSLLLIFYKVSNEKITCKDTNEIFLSVTPVEKDAFFLGKEYKPHVFYQGKMLDITDGHTNFAVKDGGNISVSYDELVKDFIVLKLSLNDQKRINEKIVQDTSAENLIVENKSEQNEVNSIIASGVNYRIKGDFDNALSEYNKALVLSPGNLNALEYKGYVLYRLGKLKDAEKITRKLYDTEEDNNINVIMNLLKIYCSTGKLDMAKEIIDQKRKFLNKNKEMIYMDGELQRECSYISPDLKF